MTVKECFQFVINHIKYRQYVDFEYLNAAMIYLHITGDIDYETYREMTSLCSTNFKVVAETPNRIVYVSYSEKVKQHSFSWKDRLWDDEEDNEEEELDFFPRKKLIEQIYHVLHNDTRSVLVNQLRGETPKETFEKFLAHYGEAQVPDSILWNVDEFLDIAPCAHLCEDGTLYYVESTFERGGGDLKKCNINEIGREKKWDMNNDEILLPNVGRGLYYAPLEEAIYMPYPYPVRDTFIRYDIGKKEYITEYHSSLLDINKKGELVYLKKEDDIELTVRGKNSERIIGVLQKGAGYKQMLPDSVVIEPKRYGRTIEMPYRIDFSGKIVPLDSREYVKIFWRHIVASDICRSGFFMLYPTKGYRISDYLKREEISRAPEHMTIRELRKRFKEIAAMGIVYSGRYFPVNNTMELLLKKGFEEDEDVTKVMFRLVYYSKMYTYGDFSWTNLFHKSFYFTLYRLAKREDFREQLLNNPNELFKENIYWTEELIAKESEEKYFSFKLASFDIVDKHLEIEEEKDVDGIIENNISVRPKNLNNYRGTVSYDIKNDEYAIHWVDDFDLELIHEVENYLELGKKCRYDFDNMQDMDGSVAISDVEVIS